MLAGELEESKGEEKVFEGEIYTVQPGEHLMQIARALEKDWEELAGFNEIEPPYLLFPGDILYLPTELSVEPSEPVLADLPPSYTASRPESLYALAYRFGLSWSELAGLNRISFPFMISTGQSIVLQN